MSADTCVDTHYGEREQPLPATPAPYAYISFNGSSSYIDCGSDASLDNIPATPGGFTVDAWCLLETDTTPILVSKFNSGGNGWAFGIGAFQLFFAVDSQFANGQCFSNEVLSLNTAYHVAGFFDGLDLWAALDGQWCTYGTQIPINGILTDDSDGPMLLGIWSIINLPNSVLDGHLYWLRISAGDRFGLGVDFTPPVMCDPPVVDGTTIELWAMDEGTGAVTAASVNSPTNDGVMTDCTWHGCV